MRNLEIAKLFSDIADLLDIQGENPFRIRAYRKAAQNLEALPEDIASIASRGDLQEIPGIGKDLASKITEYLETGKLKFLEDLKKKVPEGLIEIMNVQSVGPKKAKLFYESLGIKDIATLEQAAREGKLRKLPGMGPKSEANILRGIAIYKEGGARMNIWQAIALANGVIDALSGIASLELIEVAGSFRRRKETVGDLDFLAISEKPEEIMEAFASLPDVREVLGKGKTKCSILNNHGFQMDLRVLSRESYGAALAYFTGSKAHNIRVRDLALKKGLRINEYGFFREADETRLGGEKEEELYDLLGMTYVPPELREDRGEIEAAIENRLPRLLERSDIIGDLHIHSKYSDGAHEIFEIASAAKEMGLKYIAITDHSPSLGIAHGVSIDDLKKKRNEIEEWNKRSNEIRILNGTEVDIRIDGSLDYPDEVLKELDVVIASIHSAFARPRDEQTKRIISAMRNPYVHIIGHPTGRLIGQRDAIDIDMEEVVKEAAKTRTALELNAQPQRLDITDTICRLAKENGVKVVINTDAHMIKNLEFMDLGVYVARRGWLEKDDVLNTMEWKELLTFFESKKRGN